MANSMRTSGRARVWRLPAALLMAVVLLLSTAGAAWSAEEAAPTWEDLGLDTTQQRFLVLMAQGLIPVVGWEAYGVVEGGAIPEGSDDVNVTRAAQVQIPAVGVEDFIEFLNLSAALAYVPTDLIRFQAATGVVVTAVEVDADVTDCPARQVEISIWRAIGLQAFAPLPGFRTPDAGMTEGTAFLCRLGLQSGLFVWSQNPGQQFTTAYPIGVFRVGGHSIVVFATPDTALGRAAVTVATDPDDPNAYGVRQGPVELVDLPDVPDVPTPEMVDLAIALGWSTPPVAETPPAEETPPLVESGPADASTTEDGAAVVDPGDVVVTDDGAALASPEPSDDNGSDGISPGWVLVPIIAVVAGVATVIAWVRRRRPTSTSRIPKWNPIWTAGDGDEEALAVLKEMTDALGGTGDVADGGFRFDLADVPGYSFMDRRARFGDDDEYDDDDHEDTEPEPTALERFHDVLRGYDGLVLQGREFRWDPDTGTVYERRPVEVEDHGATLGSASDEVVVL